MPDPSDWVNYDNAVGHASSDSDDIVKTALTAGLKLGGDDKGHWSKIKHTLQKQVRRYNLWIIPCRMVWMRVNTQPLSISPGSGKRVDRWI